MFDILISYFVGCIVDIFSWPCLIVSVLWQYLQEKWDFPLLLFGNITLQLVWHCIHPWLSYYRLWVFLVKCNPEKRCISMTFIRCCFHSFTALSWYLSWWHINPKGIVSSEGSTSVLTWFVTNLSHIVCLWILKL